MDYYVFKSTEGENKPLTRQQALNILKNSAVAVGIKNYKLVEILVNKE